MKRPSADSILTSAADWIRKKRSDAHFELYLTRRNGLEIEAKDGKIDALENSLDQALSVRVFRAGRSGFSFTTDFEPGAIQRACESAVEIAELMEPDPSSEVPAWESETILAAAEGTQSDVPESKKIALALELEALTRAADKRIQGIRGAGYSESHWTKTLLRSDGTSRSDSGSMHSVSVTCKAAVGEDAQMGGSFRHSKEFAGLDPKRAAKDAAERACETLGAKPVKSMLCPAVLRNDTVSELIGFLASSFSAEEIAKQRSLLLGKLGKPVFSKHLTLIDDATYRGGYATRLMDGEGIPSRPLTLVRDGVFAAAMYDSRFAKREGTRSTGHAARDFRSSPSISASNLLVTPGKTSFQKLIESVHNGVLLTDLMGTHTANPVTGDFSFGAAGILIENGRLTTPFRGAAVSGNILEVLANIMAVGSDLDAFGSVLSPSLAIERVSLGGTA